MALAGHWHWAAAGPHWPCPLCGLGRRPLGLRLRRSSSSKCHPSLSVSCLRDSLSKPASRGLPHHRSERTRSSKVASRSPPASITRALAATPPAESTPVLAPSVCPPGGVSVGSVFCHVPDGHRHRRAPRGHSMPAAASGWLREDRLGMSPAISERGVLWGGAGVTAGFIQISRKKEVYLELSQLLPPHGSSSCQ